MSDTKTFLGFPIVEVESLGPPLPELTFVPLTPMNILLAKGYSKAEAFKIIAAMQCIEFHDLMYGGGTNKRKGVMR